MVNGSLSRWLEILKVSAKLGLTSFGGPAAHLGYFYNEYVLRRKWLDERTYTDLVALGQFLPGPASSQVGIGIGILRGGLIGGLVSWIGFTLPSVVLLVLFALALQTFPAGNAGWLHGLKLVAVAIVAQAVADMGRKLAPDKTRAGVVVASAGLTLLLPGTFVQVGVLLAAGLLGLKLYRSRAEKAAPAPRVPVSRRAGAAFLGLFLALLVLLPIARASFSQPSLAAADSFYRAGSLVFGGGHVVLPLLEREVVPPGWVSREDFMAGYGAAQAVPGPLFTFAAYLGARMSGIPGAALATAAIFLPAFLLIAGALPFWDTLRKRPGVRGALAGINAAVVGLLLAALYNPLWITAVTSPGDFVLAALLFVMLTVWKLPPWTAVLAGAAGGVLIGWG
ncbi:chromate efflux transporter [Paenibacillus aurantius]|uniref:Chromate efflux transporter n=1 Tax=Paenibacillus aurantius TaxID=2918900 RepID=A0AA96LFS8_9BACL|nr:chromate efflux transporter [Paenibacillus aurantius]WNQ11206.1 chromate efflux transporter [Paenibacillus aurantius]